MRYPMITTLVVAMLLVVGGALLPALAQDNTQDAASPSAAQNTYDSNTGTTSSTDTSPHTISGTVVTSDSQNLTIRTASGEEMTFAVSAAALPSGLAAGSRVDVSYTSQSGGQLQATTVAMSAGASGGTAGTMNESGASTSSSSGTETMGQGSQRLPSAASPMPMIAITGLIALAAALGLRFATNRG